MGRAQETLVTERDEQASPLVLGRYRLERRLGAGGFGVVWLAHDERLQREVAVKVIPRDGTSDARSEREARAAARLNHPGIVALYELAFGDDQAFLVSEFVRGRPLSELIAAGGLSDREVARIGGALCDALEHAHGRGVIHRDVKPQNVIVASEDEPERGTVAVGGLRDRSGTNGFAKLTDFGVAHLASGDPLTGTGDVVGTLAYMAPEQADGERVTPACDVYSLALTLYEAWTGTNPVRGPGPASTARRVGRRLRPLGSRRRDLPPSLCEAIDAALDPRADRRPSTAELRSELQAVEEELSDEGRLPRRRSGHRPWLAALPARPGSRTAGVLARLAAGGAAALLVFAVLRGFGPEPPPSPLTAAGIVLVAVMLLPRAGWAGGALCVCGWLASSGRAGTALVLAPGLIAAPLLLRGRGSLWSLPALAPLLGTTSLAPAFVGVAALAGGAWRRAGLATAGALWLVLGELLVGRGLLLGVPDGVRPRAEWEGSLAGATEDGLYPLVTSPAPVAIALVWAVFAVALPVAVRGRRPAVDLAVGSLWAAALASAHAGLAEVVSAGTALGEARGASGGALVGALAAVAGTALRHQGEPSRERPQPAASG